MSVKTFAEAVKEHITRYTRAFGIEQAEVEEAEFASKTELAAKPSKAEAETIAGEAVKKTELPAATAVATGNIAALSGIPAKGETDEVTLVANQIVLLVGQTAKAQNGPWEVKAGAWVRPAGFESGSEQSGQFVAVISGKEHTGSVWVMTNLTKVTVDTTATTWVENSAVTGLAIRKEESLGEKSGGVSLDLSKATIFRVTVTGTTAFTFINAPAYPIEVELLVTQDATGGRKWSVEGISWVGPVPAFVLAAKELAAINLLIAEVGKQILAGGSLLGVTNANTTALGYGAGVVGVSNTLLGQEAGKETEAAGTGNTAVGRRALALNKVGVGNTAIGESALYRATGSESTAVGHEALNNFTSNYATALGAYASAALTTGESCTAVGHLALANNKTGGSNTAIGDSALGKATSGWNTAIGASAGKETTTGANNTAIGFAALNENKTGEKNTTLGAGAGKKTTGSSNVFIGYAAGEAAEEVSNKLYIANTNTAEPLILGVFPNSELTFNTTKIALYKGVSPVSRHAAITSPAAELASLKTAVDALREAVKAIGITA
jgi:hypothetical protein